MKLQDLLQKQLIPTWRILNAHTDTYDFLRRNRKVPPLELKISSLGTKKFQEGNCFWNSYIRGIEYDTIDADSTPPQLSPPKLSRRQRADSLPGEPARTIVLSMLYRSDYRFRRRASGADALLKSSIGLKLIFVIPVTAPSSICTITPSCSLT